MLKFILPLAILPVLGLGQPAAAQQPYWWQATNPNAPGAQYDQQDYDPESVYGPDPYASRADRFDDDQYRAYRREMWRRYHRGNDYPPPRDYGSYNQDEGNVPYAAPVYPVQPQAQGKVLVQPGGKPVVVKKKVVAPAKPATTTASTAPATTTTSPAAAASTDTATASTAPATAPAATTPPATAASASAAPASAAKKGGPVTCDKGASIVSSFGFEKVTNKTCEGASLVYSAERGGKPFEIEVNPKSGELTAVKKL